MIAGMLNANDYIIILRYHGLGRWLIIIITELECHPRCMTEYTFSHYYCSTNILISRIYPDLLLHGSRSSNFVPVSSALHHHSRTLSSTSSQLRRLPPQSSGHSRSLVLGTSSSGGAAEAPPRGRRPTDTTGTPHQRASLEATTRTLAASNLGMIVLGSESDRTSARTRSPWTSCASAYPDDGVDTSSVPRTIGGPGPVSDQAEYFEQGRQGQH